MNFKIEFNPDKNYYTEAYNEIISTKFFKKHQALLGIFIIIFGCIFNLINKNEKMNVFSIIIFGIGIYEFVTYFLFKKKWIDERLNSKVFQKKIELQFYDDYLVSFGPFSEGKINWNGLKEIIKTKKGILIRIETGVSIYLSDKVFKNKSEIDFIISKKNKDNC
jgi:hypothetical protein